MGTTTTLALSFAVGIALFGSTIILGWLSTTYKWNENFTKWIVLPVISFVVTFLINIIVQTITCKKTEYPKIASGAILVPVFVLCGLLISLSGLIRSPIESAIPLASRLKYGSLFAIGYYVFWAGMFGEAFSGGFAQACLTK